MTKAKGMKKTARTPIKSIQTLTSTRVIKNLMAIRGILIADLLQLFGISYPTARLLLRDPKRMTGHQRQKLSRRLGVESKIMDEIISGRIKSVEMVFRQSANGGNDGRIESQISNDATTA